MRTLIRSLLGLWILSGLAQPAVADGRVEFILDGSGSMLGDAGGEPKVAAAKRVMKDLLRRIELPADTKVGLTFYGHRRKGDCADIERLAPVAYGERARLTPAIDGLSPKGKTPIADSLRIVGESLRRKEGATSIVLVSDGIETCGKDPCAVAKALREQYGIDVTIHVVGFDVKEGQEQLQCIAKAGGGEFRTAIDAAGLAKVLHEIGAVVQELAKPRTVTAAASLLSALVVEPLTLEGFPKIESIGVHKAGKRCQGNWGEQVARVTQTGKKILVEPGTYDIVLKATGVGKKNTLVAGLEVPPKQTVTVHTDKVAAGIKVPEMEGIEHKGVYVVKAGGARSAFRVVTHSFNLQFTKQTGTVMTVEPDCPYDVLINTGQDNLLPIAKKVTPKQGELMVIQ